MDLQKLNKDDVAEEWRRRAPAWNQWAEVVERMAARFNAPLIDAAALEPGQRVLDLASGAGEPALGIARRIGPNGRIMATDMVSEMLAGTARRAAAAGLGNVDTELCDMEALPFDDASFDRVTCRFGLMFAADPVAAMREAARVLKPGGRTAWMVWGPLAETTIFVVINTVVRQALSLPPADDSPQFRFGPTGLLTEVMTKAGLTDVIEQDCEFSPRPALGSRFWEPQVQMSFGHLLGQLSARQREEIDDRIEAAFAAHLDGEQYALKARVHIGVGVRST